MIPPHSQPVCADDAEIARLQQEVASARNFPANTTPASRHLELIADALAKGDTYAMLTEEPGHCAITMYSVLAGFYSRQAQSGVQCASEPVAWIVRWKTVHTPKNASAYLNEADAKRAAANVKMYAHASDVTVIPAFALAPDPVAYRVKDFADGWILCHTREVAEFEADGQCLIQPLYLASLLPSTQRGCE